MKNTVSELTDLIEVPRESIRIDEYGLRWRKYVRRSKPIGYRIDGSVMRRDYSLSFKVEEKVWLCIDEEYRWHLTTKVGDDPTLITHSRSLTEMIDRGEVGVIRSQTYHKMGPKAPMSVSDKAREAERFWSAWERGEAYRVPIIFHINAANIVEGVDGIKYFNDPIYMMQIQLEGQRWIWENVPMDQLEPKEWYVHPDFQNFLEAGWFGCPIKWSPGSPQQTYPLPLIKRKDKFNFEIPDPLKDNLMAKVYEFYKIMVEKTRNMTYAGRKIRVGGPTGTDGPFTVAYLLRGPSIFADMVQDPDFVDKLMDYITEATIIRMKTWMDYLGVKYPMDFMWFADDAIQNLSVRLYRRFVLPYHKRILQTFTTGKRSNFIHLCGRVQHLLKTIKDELNVGTFELGFPIDLGLARRELGQEVHLIGNVNPAIILNGPEELIEMEVKKIFESGVAVGEYNFTLSDGNQVAPRTPLKHLYAFYNAGLKYGRYPEIEELSIITF
ncbi:MAG: uroporphyrinogen decarboxylase family protein [Thermoproteota archaeon]